MRPHYCTFPGKIKSVRHLLCPAWKKICQKSIWECLWVEPYPPTVCPLGPNTCEDSAALAIRGNKIMCLSLSESFFTFSSFFFLPVSEKGHLKEIIPRQSLFSLLFIWGGFVASDGAHPLISKANGETNRSVSLMHEIAAFYPLVWLEK